MNRQQRIGQLFLIIALFCFGTLSANSDFDIPPFAKEMLEKEGITVEDLKNDGELRKKWLNKFREMRNAPTSKKKDKPSQKSTANGDFYRVIVDNNLFRPLGYRKPKPGPSFELIATLVDHKTGKSKALIQSTKNRQIYYIGVGENFAGTKIEKIEPLKVTLLHNGKLQEFSIAQSGFLSGGGGGRRGGGRPQPPSGGNPPQKSRGTKSKVKNEKVSNRSKDKAAKERKEAIKIMKARGGKEGVIIVK